jgi:hypothetical protein
MDIFKHEPLDHERQSIRLLRVLTNDGSPGTLQCTIRHTTINTEYTCLSYRWGNDVPANRILINGTEIFVRKNLFEFLQIATKHEWQKQLRHLCDRQEQRTSDERWYWIDALCIDQNNFTERNHQVQQMGKIFESAAQVFIWLGTNGFSRFLTKSTRLMEHDPYSANYILYNEYWRRAWVTQEVVLARYAVLLLNEEAVELNSFASEVNKALYGQRDMEMITQERFWIDGSPFMQFTTNVSSIRGTSLVELLVRFKNRECTVARDRIFSLLSICSEGTNVKVDYSLPDEEIVFQTLQSSKEQLCLCSAAIVARALEVKDSPTFSFDSPSIGLHPQPYIEFDVHAQLVQPNSWCVLYSDEHRHPGIYLGEGPGTIFNSWKTCPMEKDFRLYWLQPSSPLEGQTIWSEPFRACDNNQLIPVCQYEEGFSVRKKHEMQEAARIGNNIRNSDRSRLSTGADDLDTIRWNFDHSQMLDFHGGNMSFHGIEQRQQENPEQYTNKLDVYTIRMSFPVLTKILMTNVTRYNAHCDFKRNDCTEKGFEYARIGRENRSH